LNTTAPETATSRLPQPFDGVSPAYRSWRESRLAHQAEQTAGKALFAPLPCIETLSQPLETSRAILKDLCEQVQRHGFALYRWQTNPADPINATAALNRLLGLAESQSDAGVVNKAGLSLLSDRQGESIGRFIPYSNRAMNWHTDGYYNDMDSAVRCFTLHCVNAASDGGSLSLMDYELLLIALYDEDPALVEHLSHPQAMMLPANKDGEGHDRPDRHVPVLYTYSNSTNPAVGMAVGMALGMRFTARGKNIQWRNDETRHAMQRVLEMIEEKQDWQHTVTLQSGEGVITRNVLHRRESFSDSAEQSQRQILRGRYNCLPGIETAAC